MNNGLIPQSMYDKNVIIVNQLRS